MKGDGNSSRVTHMFPLPKKNMKVSKKLLAAIMAAAMVIPMGTASAFADETATPDTKSTNVKYAVTAGYEWTIHAEVDFGSDKGVKQNVAKENNTVSVNKNVIPDGKKLTITVAGSGESGAFTIASGNTKLNYTIKEGANSIVTRGTVMDVAAGTNAASKNLTFTLTTGNGSSEVAGNYTGTVAYTAAIVDNN